MAMEPVESVAWSSVIGVQITFEATLLAALVDFQTPPYAPPIYTVLPEGSAGSMAMEVARPATW